MSRIPVFVLLLLALSGVLCDASQKKDSKRTVDWKKPDTKSTKEKRDSSELTAIYTVKQKEEPFRPLYEYHYPGAPLRATSTRYIAAATTPQLSYSKPDAVIGIGGGPSIGGGSEGKGSTTSAGSSGGIQYASANSYKPEGGIQYAPSAYKSTSSSGGGIQYASSAYRGPFITTYQPVSAGQAKVHQGSLYAPPPSSPHPPAAVTLPLHYGGFEQQLPPQHHHQNQYAIAFPTDYVRHYQQNLPAPFPLHGAHMVPLVYAPAPAPGPLLKDQSFKQGTVHYISLAPQPSASVPSASAAPLTGPTVITHFIPYYGAGPQPHQQFQQQSQAQFYFGGHSHQSPTTFAYPALQTQQQTIQIVPKHQIFGPIQMASVGAAAAATVPIIPFKPIGAAQQQEQQLQQPLHHFHQHHHPGATTSYNRYSQNLSGASGSGGGNSSPIEVPASGTSSSSALKLGPLYSSPSSTSSANIYAGATGGSSGKMSYTYASDANSVGPVYTHPGAIHYGTHLYHPSTKVVEIGSNRVTAGSAAIAGVGPPAYHPQQQSAASNSHGGGVGNSSPVVKFS